MNRQAVIDFFKKNEDEHGRFDNIPPERRYSEARDLNAFILLDKLLPGKRTQILASAGHDEVYLSPDIEDLGVLTEENLLDLIRCGIWLSRETDSLVKFV